MIDIKYFKDGDRHVICIEDNEISEKIVKDIISKIMDVKFTEYNEASVTPTEPEKKPDIPVTIQEGMDRSEVEIPYEKVFLTGASKDKAEVFDKAIQSLKECTDPVIKDRLYNILKDYTKERFCNTNAVMYSMKLNERQVAHFLSDSSFGYMIDKNAILGAYSMTQHASATWGELLDKTTKDLEFGRSLVANVIEHYKTI